MYKDRFAAICSGEPTLREDRSWRFPPCLHARSSNARRRDVEGLQEPAPPHAAWHAFAVEPVNVTFAVEDREIVLVQPAQREACASAVMETEAARPTY
jgi:hypothetical protein